MTSMMDVASEFRKEQRETRRQIQLKMLQNGCIELVDNAEIITSVHTLKPDFGYFVKITLNQTVPGTLKIKPLLSNTI